MARVKLKWSMSATYVVVVVLCMAVLGVYVIASVRGFYLDDMTGEMQSRARLVEDQITRPPSAPRGRDLQELLRTLGDVSGTRFTVIGLDGTVLADSTTEPATMDNHAGRPEVRAALNGDVGVDTREGLTPGVEELYVAIPLRDDAGIDGVVRAAVPLTGLNEALDSLYLRIGLAALIIATVIGGVGALVSGRIGRRMRDLRTGAERFASGDFSYTIEPSRTEEFGAVAMSLNHMARRLDETIGTITEQNNEREAILTSMVEGVLAVDLDENTITLNEAAAALLNVDAAGAQGRTIQEVVRNLDLQRLVAEALAEQAPVEGEILLRTPQGDRFLQVNGTGLRDAGGMPIGAIAVLNDVTRLKSLEEMRREFVANVSHEIKTPVTGIKGFAETLLDGALDDPEAARRFARIIVDQADRLNSIVEDLLALSSVESIGAGTIGLQEANITDVLKVAVEVCAPRAAAKDITIELEAPEEMYANISPPLLEQAVVNLVDNAIKYSPAGSTVTVTQAGVGRELVLSVCDRGCGIAREHLPHLFQRFYRVDKARSRDVGGTGLGLAIVKHIAGAHGGSVSVTSALGAGSTFSIRLPRAAGTSPAIAPVPGAEPAVSSSIQRPLTGR